MISGEIFPILLQFWALLSTFRHFQALSSTSKHFQALFLRTYSLYQNKTKKTFITYFATFRNYEYYLLLQTIRINQKLIVFIRNYYSNCLSGIKHKKWMHFFSDCTISRHIQSAQSVSTVSQHTQHNQSAHSVGTVSQHSQSAQSAQSVSTISQHSQSLQSAKSVSTISQHSQSAH